MSRAVKSYSVKCPHCDAPIGEPCKTHWGWRAPHSRRAHYTHAERSRLVAAGQDGAE